MASENPAPALARPIPERIKEAREARGLSAEELAEALGVSRQAVAQYETGQTTPSADALRGILRETGQSLSFFTTLPHRPSDPKSPFFRSLKRMQAHHRRRIYRRLQWTGDIVSFLERYLELPPVDLPDVPFCSESATDEEIEAAAEALRDHWGLGRGPVRNLAEIAEAHGVLIVRDIVRCPDMDAVSCWIGGRSIVLLSAEVISGPRDLFNLSHELAHLVLHAGEEVSSENLDRLEKQANKFASAFLLPQSSFSREVLGTSLGYFLTLKDRWGVSIGAMAMRCKALGIFSDNQTSYLFRQLNAQGIRKAEPLDDIIPVAQPHVLPEGISMLLKHGVCTPSEIEESLGLNLCDVEQLCSLDPATLDQKVVSIQLRNG